LTLSVRWNWNSDFHHLGILGKVKKKKKKKQKIFKAHQNIFFPSIPTTTRMEKEVQYAPHK
jgi:hypothetical protein